MPKLSGRHLSQKSEIELGEAVAGVFHRASLEAEPLGNHSQIATQLRVAFPDVISNLAALKRRQQRVGNAPPSHPLPLLQLIYFAV